MATWLVVLLFSLAAVLLFVVGLSLTLIMKGHNIDSEIGTNKNMKARGITCLVEDERKAQGEGDSCADTLCGDSNCASCTTHE